MTSKEAQVSVNIPDELLPLLKDLAHGSSADENVIISLAITLFVARTVSLARASEIAGLSLNDFVYVLKINNIPWGEYSEKDILHDDLVMEDVIRELGE